MRVYSLLLVFQCYNDVNMISLISVVSFCYIILVSNCSVDIRMKVLLKLFSFSS